MAGDAIPPAGRRRASRFGRGPRVELAGDHLGRRARRAPAPPRWQRSLVEQRGDDPRAARRCTARPARLEQLVGDRGARGDRRPPPTARRRPRRWPRRWRARAGASRPWPVRSSICSRSRRVSSAPGRSALLITNTSAISIRPALLACTASPQPGLTTTTVVSAAPATSTSTWPTPTVSTITHGHPAASSTRTASGVASASPPRWPRVAIERMNTPASRAWSCMRTRSPRMAPPVNGDDGSMASTATARRPRHGPPAARAGEGRLAGARRAGDADGVGVAAERVGEAADGAGRVAAPLDERQEPGQGRPVAGTRRVASRSAGASASAHATSAIAY